MMRDSVPPGPRPRRSHVARSVRAAGFAALVLAACAEYLGTSFSEIAPQEISGRPVQAGGRCGLEAVNGVASGGPWHVSRARPANLRGWAIDPVSMTNSDWLVVELNPVGGGRPFYAITWARGVRDDLVYAIGPGPGIAKAAFELTGTFQRVPAGSFDVTLIVQASAGLVACRTQRQLVVA